MKLANSLFLSLMCSVLAIGLFSVHLSAQMVPTPVNKIDFSSENGPKAFSKNITTLDGETQMLRELAGSKGTMLVFSCNTCPFVIAWEYRYNDLYELCKSKGINMVLINSNEAFRNDEDAPEAMKAHHEKMGYKMPYVIDENHQIADLLEAKTTPHVFLFDNNFNLVYQGAIDDNYKNAEEVTATYAADAVEALANGETIDPQRTKALGCSIKRVKK